MADIVFSRKLNSSSWFETGGQIYAVFGFSDRFILAFSKIDFVNRLIIGFVRRPDICLKNNVKFDKALLIKGYAENTELIDEKAMSE